MNDLNTGLKRLGLTDSEIAVYLSLLEQGIGSPPSLAKATGIARTNCYHVLQGLQSKGLIRSRSKGKRVQYLPKDPEALFASIEQKKALIESLLPDLRALSAANAHKPVVHFYEGFEEVRAVYQKSLEAEVVKAFGSTKQLAAVDPAFFRRYFRQLKERGIILRDIVTYESREESLAEGKAILGYLYEPVVLSKKYENLFTDMLLWNDVVALITLKEPISAVMLINTEMAKTFNAIHDALFEQLR